MTTLKNKGKDKEKGRTIKLSKKLKCGYKVAVRKKRKKTIENKESIRFSNAWRLLVIILKLDLICFTHQRQLTTKLSF